MPQPPSGSAASKAIEEVVEKALGPVFPAAQLEIRRCGAPLLSRSWGRLDPEAGQEEARNDSLFDLASVTKLFTVTAFMTLVEEGRVGLDQAVATVLPDFSGSRSIRPYEDPLRPGSFSRVVPDTEATVEASSVRFRDLLCHSSGLPAWRPLFLEGSPTAAKAAALGTFFSYPRGTRVVYSDIGLILLGMAVERLMGRPLDEVIALRVTGPLGLRSPRFFRTSRPELGPGGTGSTAPTGIAATERCVWRGRRLRGEVHDENAAGLGGISGHAGLFATAADLALFGESYLPGATGLLRPGTVAEMTSLQAEDGALRRGLGFALWSPDPEAAANPLGRRCFGHNGFTGTSLWMDPDRELVVACLSNRVYYGRDPHGISEFRVSLNEAVQNWVDDLCAVKPIRVP
ncbi:MAG: serine hydrolase [Spirochaetota bacterium]